MSMNTAHLCTFSMSNEIVFNTKIRGVAVSIPDKASLATKLAITTGDITHFNIVDSDVYAQIETTYGMPANAFLNDTSILEFDDIEGKVISTQYRSFAGCTNLDRVNIPSASVTSSVTYSDCNAITEIIQPITEMPNSNFRHCNNLTSLVTGVLTGSINDSCFEQCRALPDLDLSNTGGYVGQKAFLNCNAFINVSIPNATLINVSAFENCSNMVTCSLPNCTQIKGNAFLYCNSLTTFTGSPTEVNYRSFQGTPITYIDLSDLVTAVSSSQFRNCAELLTVDFGTYAGDIASRMFQGCGKLTTVNGGTFGRLNSYAFEKCYKLTTIDLSGVTRVDQDGLSYCNFLTSIIMPNCTTMASNSLRSMAGLQTLGLDSVTTFPYAMGSFNSGLTSLSCDSVVTWAGICLNGASGLTTIDAPALEDLQVSGLQNLSSLISLNAPSLLTLGASVGDDSIFAGVAANIAITAPVALQTANGGGEEGDLAWARANKSATITYV